MDVRRVYGDGGEESVPEPGHAVELSAGPLDGLFLDVTGWLVEQRAEGVLLVTDKGLYGPGGRVFYAPGTADTEGPFLWHGDTP